MEKRKGEGSMKRLFCLVLAVVLCMGVSLDVEFRMRPVVDVLLKIHSRDLAQSFTDLAVLVRYVIGTLEGEIGRRVKLVLAHFTVSPFRITFCTFIQ